MLVEGVTPGQTSLSHTFGGEAQTVTLEVNNAALVERGGHWDFPMPTRSRKLFMRSAPTPITQEQSLTAVATWSSSNPVVAFVSALKDGRRLGLKSRLGYRNCSSGRVYGNRTNEVTDAEIISLQCPPVLALPAGDDGALRVYAKYYDNNDIREVTQEAAWSVEDVSLAIVSNAEGHRGEINALEPGETTVQATYEGLTDESVLIINDAPLESIFIVPFGGLETAPNRDEWLCHWHV